MAVLQRYAPLVGRILICLIFIKSGIGKIPGWEGTTEKMASQGMPLVNLFLLGAIVFELAGAFSVLLGYKARYGAMLLIIFLIPTTLIFHNFIAEPEQMTNFMKNIAILGGLFFIVGFGSGPLSLDGSGKE